MAYAEQAGTPVKLATVQSALASFDPALNRLNTILERATGCADKIVGTRPSPVPPQTDKVQAANLIAQIQDRRDHLVGLVDHLETEIQRIETGIS